LQVPPAKKQVLRFAQDDNSVENEVLRFAQDDNSVENEVLRFAQDDTFLKGPQAKKSMTIRIRLAEARDIPLLRELIEASVRGLQARDYSEAQLEGALRTVYGVDTQLIADGTYFAAEAVDDAGAESSGAELSGAASSGMAVLVGCGGWSKRKTLYGGDQFAGREDSLLDPARDAAKIRAFFVHPRWARRGIGGMILAACEAAAGAAGFRRLEMGATLTGVPFYRAKGYVELEAVEAPLGNGLTLPIVRMGKTSGG
jgi:GNAT superfamily N-acetyltransferase